MVDVLPTTTGGLYCYLAALDGRYPTVKLKAPMKPRDSVVPKGTFKRSYPEIYGFRGGEGREAREA
eukprot:scaffold8536_cov248-Pinguiococcus_pyrenoidosus.AAC.10